MTNPRRPYPGQDWKHGWIPVTAQAAVEKNHGRRSVTAAGGAGPDLRSGFRLLQDAASEQEGVQGRAYTRGWESVIAAFDEALVWGTETDDA